MLSDIHFNNPRDKRLALDYYKLKELSDNSEFVSFKILTKNESEIPDSYLITYKLRSITSIDENQNPIFGNRFSVEISLPNGYPLMRSPICFMRTDIWHPNIRSIGKYKGRMCINEQNIGSWQTLDLLIIHLADMIQYKNYHASNIQPYPEDPKVAEWIREYAEPRDIINKTKQISTDDKILASPTEEWLASRNTKSRINIKGITLKGKSKQSIFKAPASNTSAIQIKLKGTGQ